MYRAIRLTSFRSIAFVISQIRARLQLSRVPHRDLVVEYFLFDKARKAVPMDDREVLVGSRSWSATPWHYSSMRYIQFADDGSGVLVYGYGQTIYARINIRFTVKADNQLEVVYRDSPPLQCFAGFTPAREAATKNLKYTLTENPVVYEEDVNGAEFSVKWLLTFDCSPFPDTLTFPYDTPLKFYGYREDMRSVKAK